MFSVFDVVSAFGQGVRSFESKNDPEAFSIKPEKLSSGVNVTLDLSERLDRALQQRGNLAGQDLDDLSFSFVPRYIEGKSWLQYQIGDSEIGPNSLIAMQSAADGQVQILTRDNILERDFTAAFNGDTVDFYIGVHPNDQSFERSLATEGLSIDGATWGTLPGQGMELQGFGTIIWRTTGHRESMRDR
ncbi:MAG: hypothetical protein GDA36_02005 [Rhodobacteraceae bacterium]|nr:hypothetical protein [Paracoccaceae bacterium]